MISTCDVVGVVTALASAPYLNGAITAIATNGADSKKNSQMEVVATTRIPATFIAAQAMTTARPTMIPRLFTPNHGKQPRQVQHKQRGIDSHVEDAGHQRQPGFLEAPEIAHGAAHPGVKATLLRQGAGELTDHVGGGQTPEDWSQ